MSNSKKRLFLALSLCSVLILIYIVLYAGQGQGTASLTKIGIDRDETLKLYNSWHADTKLSNSFYSDEDIFKDSQIKKYVYHFTLSANSRIFRKNYIYNIYPEFNTMQNPIEYAYMQIHGDKYGSLVSSEKLKLDNIGPISINLVMNNKIFYWLIFGIFAILFICYVVPFVLRKIQLAMINILQPTLNKLQPLISKNIGQSSTMTMIAPPPTEAPFHIYLLYILSHWRCSLYLIATWCR